MILFDVLSGQVPVLPNPGAVTFLPSGHVSVTEIGESPFAFGHVSVKEIGECWLRVFDLCRYVNDAQNAHMKQKIFQCIVMTCIFYFYLCLSSLRSFTCYL